MDKLTGDKGHRGGKNVAILDVGITLFFFSLSEISQPRKSLKIEIGCVRPEKHLRAFSELFDRI